MPFETEYSNFPKEKIKLHKYKNIDDDIRSEIEKINSLRAQGDYDQAAGLIKNSPHNLSQYIIDAATFRTLEEEIYNTQIYAKQRQQFIYFDKKEPDALYSDVWISDNGMLPKPKPPIEDTEIIHTYNKTCPLSDGIWEGAVLSEEYYVHLCDKNTTSSWTYHHNLGMDIEKITSLSGNIYSNNDYNFCVEAFQNPDNISIYRHSKLLYTPSLAAFGINNVSDTDNIPTTLNSKIRNPKLGYVYVNSLFTDSSIYDAGLNPSCFLKLYAYPDYVKFEFTYETKQEDSILQTLNIPDMAIRMRSIAPIFSFSFSYTD